jgi:DNA modification methylase
MSKDKQQSAPAMIRDVWFVPPGGFAGAHFAVMPDEIARRCIVAGCPEGGVVLDPFGGAGTTALVADRFGRDAVLIELHPANVELARQRIKDEAPLLAEVA